MDDRNDEEARIWGIGLCDAHCHPTDIVSSIADIANMKAKALTIMSTRSQDQDLVSEAGRKYPLDHNEFESDGKSTYTVPSFGWHPWFSHQVFDDRDSSPKVAALDHYRSVLNPVPEDLNFLQSLPQTKSLSELIEETGSRLENFPFALVGEIGIDRSFRLPEGPEPPNGDTSNETNGSSEVYTAGAREGRPLTPYRVSMDHQKIVFKAQLKLAAKFQRPVSIHSVQAHGVVFDLLQQLWKGHEKKSKREQKRSRDVTKASDTASDLGRTIQSQTSRDLPFPPRICMHSYSGPADALRQFLNPSVPAKVYFSFSTAINFSTPSAAKVSDVIRKVPDDRILIESDLHCAGERMDFLLMDILVKICGLKGWSLLDGAQKLKRNWENFVFGD